MKNRPTGNVTFLFTDIEGSTRLAQEFPDSLPAALEKHNAIMHKATKSNNGFVFEIIGDAFYCAFDNAVDAIKAAIEAQVNLYNEKWEDVKIKIRIGIHSGNAEWNGKRYMGYITLARTARVMSASYGEQIIISNDAYELAKEKLLYVPKREFGNEQARKISFRDLGDRRLKDLKQPVRLFQILAKGLREDFPPLKTLDARPNNLPVQLTSFIGRETEMKRVKDLLKNTHLLTLTGSGGAGKTRFALQIAADVIDDFANGVWFVELASLSEQAFLPQAIMKVFGIKEEPKRSPEDTLCDYLRDKEMLIILDNCEHLVEECAKLTEKLLINSPKLKIIATSREALRCDGEQTHRVLSLEVPDPKDEDTPEKLSQYESVRLFIERALAVDSTFRVNNNNAPALAEICYQLDGIPLAMELAAARTKVLSVEQIYERLNDRFNLLTEGKRTALPRQQTLRALIDWSYDLLSEKEKILWSRLSVFSGGWTLEAAEEVCSDEKKGKEEVCELLNQLTEKSIVVFEKENERYRILETLKQYGEEKLRVTGEAEDALNRHLNYFMKLAETAEPKLKGSEVQQWLEKLESEHDNLLAAIEWSSREGDKDSGAKLAGALAHFWEIRGHYSTGIRLLERILDSVLEIDAPSHGKALNWAARFNAILGEYEAARKFYDMKLALAIEFEDKESIADSLIGFGFVAFEQGENERAQKYYEESLFLYSEIKNKRGIAVSLNNLGNVAINQGDYVRAAALYEKSLVLKRERKDKFAIALTLRNLGGIAFKQGEFDRAQDFFEENLSFSKLIQDLRGISMNLNNLGGVAFEKGEYDRAREFYKESLALKRVMGDSPGIAISLENSGNLEIELQQYDQALEYFEESIDVYRKIGNKSGIATSFNNFGKVEFMRGQNEQARISYEKGLSLLQEIGNKSGVAESLDGLGKLACINGNYEQAQKYLEDSIALRIELGSKHAISESLIGFSELLVCIYKPDRAVILLGSVEFAINSKIVKLKKSIVRLQEQTINKLYERLSKEEFSKYFEEGKKLTLVQAADLALSNVL